MNEFLKKIESKDITENNDLFYLGAALVTKVFENAKLKGEKEQPWWKLTLERQVMELNKDLGRQNSLLGDEEKHQDDLQKKYRNCIIFYMVQFPDLSPAFTNLQH